MADNKTVRVEFKVSGVAGFCQATGPQPDEYNKPGSGSGKWLVTICVPKDSEDAKTLKRAIATVTKKAFGCRPNETTGANKKVSGFLAFADGDESDRASEHGCWVVSAKSASKPIPVYEIKNREFVPTEDLNSGYEITLAGSYYSVLQGTHQMVCAAANAAVVLKKTANADPMALFGEKMLDEYQNTAIEGGLGEVVEAEEAEEEEEEEEVAPVKAKKTRKAKANPVEPEEEDDDDDEEEEEVAPVKAKKTRKAKAKPVEPEEEGDDDWGEV